MKIKTNEKMSMLIFFGIIVSIIGLSILNL